MTHQQKIERAKRSLARIATSGALPTDRDIATAAKCVLILGTESARSAMHIIHERHRLRIQ